MLGMLPTRDLFHRGSCLGDNHLPCPHLGSKLLIQAPCRVSPSRSTISFSGSHKSFSPLDFHNRGSPLQILWTGLKSPKSGGLMISALLLHPDGSDWLSNVGNITTRPLSVDEVYRWTQQQENVGTLITSLQKTSKSLNLLLSIDVSKLIVS